MTIHVCMYVSMAAMFCKWWNWRARKSIIDLSLCCAFRLSVIIIFPSIIYVRLFPLADWREHKNYMLHAHGHRLLRDGVFPAQLLSLYTNNAHPHHTTAQLAVLFIKTATSNWNKSVWWEPRSSALEIVTHHIRYYISCYSMDRISCAGCFIMLCS